MEKVKKQINDTEIKSIDEETRTIWHKISVEEEDLMGDIVRIDGIDTSNFKKKPGVIYGHQYGGVDPVPVIGENVGFKKEGKALYAGTKFLPTEGLSQKLKDLVNDLWTLNKKKLMGWSIGFKPTEAGPIKDKDGKETGGYEYKKSLLLEYSNVIIPANQGAVNDAIEQGVVSKNLKASLNDDVINNEPDEESEGEIGEVIETVSVDGGTKEKSVFLLETEPVEISRLPKNEHSCRLGDPEKYESSRQEKRKHDGKEYSIIYGKLKDEDTWEEQAFRYPVKDWKEAEARKHCQDHDGIKFEPAEKEKQSTQSQGMSPDDIDAFRKILEGLKSNMEILTEAMKMEEKEYE